MAKTLPLNVAIGKENPCVSLPCGRDSSSAEYRQTSLRIGDGVRERPDKTIQHLGSAMRNWSNVAAGLLALGLAACAVYEKKQPVLGDKAIVAAYVAAWNAHDTVAIDTLLTRDATHEDIAHNFRGKSPGDVKKFMLELLAAEPDFKWKITNTIEDGRFVALEWTWTATYTGPDPSGKNVTGKRISGRGTSVAEVEDGRIRRFTDYYDDASFFR